MATIVVVCVTFMAACAPSGPTPAAVPTGTGDLFISGYHPWWAQEGWADYPWNELDALFYFELEVNARGEIRDTHGWPDGWSALLARSEAAGVQVIPTVTMHEPGGFEAVFGSAARRSHLVDQLIALLAADPAIRGLHLDFELFQPVELEVRDGYTGFVAELRREMEALDPGLGLSLFLLGFDDDDVYNEAALAALADYFVVQAYDFHSPGSSQPGPVTAEQGWGRLSWQYVVDRLTALEVPRERILLSVPLYGYEWPASGPEVGAATRGLGNPIPLTAPSSVLPTTPRARAQAARHGENRDDGSGSTYYSYQDPDGGWVQGWFHGADGLSRMMEFARRERLGGVAFFPLAYGDAALWRTLLGNEVP